MLITHIELHKGYHGYANIWSLAGIQNLGPVGVYFFFSLSGFLITWLLQRDNDRPLNQTLKKFYLRRAARILPLYYLMVLLAFFVLPLFDVFSYGGSPAGLGEIALFTLWQPHVSSAFLPRVANISHLWSIGVELTFYLFWPLVVLRSSDLHRTIMVFVGTIIGLKAGVLFLAPNLVSNPQPFFHLAATLKFECMAIGAFFALPLPVRVSRIVDTPAAVWCCLAGIPGLFLLYGTALDNIVHIPMAVLFGVVIRSTTTRNSPVRFFDNRVAQFVGKISYGVYCWHVLCLSAVLNLLPRDSFGLLGFNLLVYGGVFASTVCLSAVSFFAFEAPITAYVRRRTQLPSNSQRKAAGVSTEIRRAA